MQEKMETKRSSWQGWVIVFSGILLFVAYVSYLALPDLCYAEARIRKFIATNASGRGTPDRPGIVLVANEIALASPAVLTQNLDRMGKDARLIELASMGGITKIAHEMAETISKSGLPVRVSLVCGSACVRLYTSVPSTRRLITDDGILWFHLAKMSWGDPSCFLCRLADDYYFRDPEPAPDFDPVAMLGWADAISPNLGASLRACDVYYQPAGAAYLGSEIEAMIKGSPGPSCDELRSRGKDWATQRATDKYQHVGIEAVPADWKMVRP